MGPKKNYIGLRILVIAVVFLASCSNSSDAGDSNFRQDSLRLQSAFTNLKTLSKSIDCSDPEEWQIALVGSKACGGNQTALPYHNSIETSFLAAVDDYTAQQRAFIIAYGIVSDCTIAPVPDRIVCEDGNAVLKY
jgi:hypothetical protein